MKNYDKRLLKKAVRTIARNVQSTMGKEFLKALDRSRIYAKTPYDLLEEYVEKENAEQRPKIT